MNSYTITYRDGIEKIEHTADGHTLDIDNGMAILSDEDGAVTFAVPLDRLLSIARIEAADPETAAAETPASTPSLSGIAGLRPAPIGWENRHFSHTNIPDSLKDRIMHAGFEWEQIVPNTIVLTIPIEQSDPRRRVSFALQAADGRIIDGRRGFEYDSLTTPPPPWVTPNPIKSAIVAAGYDWDKVVDVDSIRPIYTGSGTLRSVDFGYLTEVVTPVSIAIPS